MFTTAVVTDGTVHCSAQTLLKHMVNSWGMLASYPIFISELLKRTKENLSQGHYTHSQIYIGDASGYSAFSVVV